MIFPFFVSIRGVDGSLPIRWSSELQSLRRGMSFPSFTQLSYLLADFSSLLPLFYTSVAGFSCGSFPYSFGPGSFVAA